jgi:hypothetical protein
LYGAIVISLLWLIYVISILPGKLRWLSGIIAFLFSYIEIVIAANAIRKGLMLRFPDLYTSGGTPIPTDAIAYSTMIEYVAPFILFLMVSMLIRYNLPEKSRQNNTPNKGVVLSFLLLTLVVIIAVLVNDNIHFSRTMIPILFLAIFGIEYYWIITHENRQKKLTRWVSNTKKQG